MASDVGVGEAGSTREELTQADVVEGASAAFAVLALPVLVRAVGVGERAGRNFARDEGVGVDAREEAGDDRARRGERHAEPFRFGRGPPEVVEAPGLGGHLALKREAELAFPAFLVVASIVARGGPRRQARGLGAATGRHRTRC